MKNLSPLPNHRTVTVFYNSPPQDPNLSHIHSLHFLHLVPSRCVSYLLHYLRLGVPELSLSFILSTEKLFNNFVTSVYTACCASRTVHSLQDIVDKLTNHEACHYTVCFMLLLRPVLSRSLACFLHKSEYEVGTPTKRLTDSSDRTLHSSCRFHDGKADCVAVPLVAYSRFPVLLHPQSVFIDRMSLNVTRVKSKQVELLYPNTTY